jgi:hypothetical protein
MALSFQNNEREKRLGGTSCNQGVLPSRQNAIGGEGRFRWKIARFDHVAGTTDDRRTGPSRLLFGIRDVHFRLKNNVGQWLSKASPFSLKMKVEAFKEGLDSKKSTEIKGPVSWAFAEEFNRLIEEAKKVEPAMAEHLPEFIKFVDTGMGVSRVQHVDYIHIEIKVRQIIGAIRLIDSRA